MKFIKVYIKRNKDLVNFFGGIFLVICFIVFGPKLSKWYGKYYNDQINKNGKIIKGEILGFSYNRGSYIHVRYYYNSIKYELKEMQSNEKDTYVIGQEVNVMLDSTDPHESYVVEFNN